MEEKEILQCSHDFAKLNRGILSFGKQQDSKKELTPPEFGLLFAMYIRETNHEKSTASQIAQQFNVTIAAIMHPLDSLIKRGFILKEEAEDDKRVKYIKLREKARDLICDEKKNIIKRMRFLFDALGENDTKEFIRIMHKMLEIMEGKNEMFI